MEDTKRGTGRTTRMLVAAVMYKLAHPTAQVVVVGHDRNGMIRLQSMLSTVFQSKFVPQLHWNYKRNYDIVGNTSDVVFYDHRCFHDTVMELRKVLAEAEQEYTKYDL
jgi:hypothetical protein